MRIVVPVESGCLCGAIGRATQFASIHLDVQARRVFNWSNVCPPSKEPGEIIDWLLRIKPDVIIVVQLEERLGKFLSDMNIIVLETEKAFPVSNLVEEIVQGRWHPEMFDHRLGRVTPPNSMSLTA
jgi:hypothetical protein